ncbi:MAG: hypothetical protein JSW34_06760 [Candidatus Zixiibacteriota bacterium]|nr:MAG: hypothetical protein JSW34_06760 [candidate division Zixibacteria bacterium]
MYCPNCKFDYDKGIAVCPDCGEPLVVRLSEQLAAAISPDDSWVLIGSVDSEAKAKVARGSLDSSNIPSVFLPSRLEAGRAPESVPTGLDLSDSADLILVPKEFGEEARVLLEAVLGEELNQPKTDNPLI